MAESQPVHETADADPGAHRLSRMLEADNDREAESRLANLDELVNAAAEAAERGEGHRGFSGSRRAGGR